MRYAFDFALSFSGECRALAKELSELLVKRGTSVFYDDSFLAHLFGKRLDYEFSGKFGEETRYFVPFVSSGYSERPWPQYEWGVAKLEAQRRGEEFILPLRVDDTLLLGLPDTVCYLDLRTMELSEVANILVAKLESSFVSGDPEPRSRAWVATFGMLLEKLEGEQLPENAPRDAPALYDWLTEDMMERLGRTSMPHVQILEDLRDGEQLSIRLGLEWDLSKEALNFGDMGWWELLELAPHEDVFG